MFESRIPASFHDLFLVVRSFGYTPILVGGVVRDFLLKGIVGHDWDLELHHESIAFSKDGWKDLGKKLSKLGRVTYLPYEIIRLDLKDIQYEFSPPRKEIFEAEWERSGHSNFEAEYDLKLDFSEAVRRRDFTVNAIGLRFTDPKVFELLDPLNGIIHLRDKLLSPCGENFQKDPVRFLRALRFAQKLNFVFSPELLKVLETMPLAGLSANYLWSEMQKSGHPLNFLKTIIQWKEKRSELKLPLDIKVLEAKWEDLARVLKDTTKHESWVVALEWVGFESESWQKYFSVSSDTCARLGRWARSSKSFIEIHPKTFHGEFEAVREEEKFALLFDWYFTTKQLLQKHPELPLLKMIEEYLPEWIHLYRFEVVKDVKHIDPPFRAKYQVWNLCQRL